MAAAYKVEHVAETPRGYKVRSVQRGAHVVRVAFPPGRRKKGSGKVVEILHPKGESNPSCIVSHQAKTNPGELLIFGVNPSKLGQQRAARERAGRIRGARLNEDKPLFDAIRAGSRVTFVDRFGKQRSGRAVMKGPYGWVLNMGGPHGTPQVVHPDMVTRVRNGNPSAHDAAWQQQKKVQEILRKMPKPIRDVFDSPKRSTRGRRRSDRKFRNPSETEEAVRLFQSFHGKDPKDIAEKHVSAAVRLDYTALGDLIALGLGEPRQGGNALVNHWQKEDHLGFEGDGVKLASAPNGKQLYLIGGNQNLAKCLSRFDVDTEKDFVDLGEIGFVVYLARKVHGNFEPVEYVHRFGEKSGALPVGMYDKLRKQIFLSGGEYFIETKDGVSPGIEN